MIKVCNLSASYKDAPLFNNLNFTLQMGTCTALCGKNGAGKSTLLSLIDGIVPNGLCVSGDILIEEKSVFALSRKQIAKKIAYLVQKELPVWDLCVKDFLLSAFYAFDVPLKEQNLRIQNALQLFKLSHLKNRSILKLSGGELQKSRLARAFLQNAPYLLFDEPAENLDIAFVHELLSLITNFSCTANNAFAQKTLLFSIHDINTAALFAKNIILLGKNGFVCGTTEEVFTKDILEDAFETKFAFYRHPLSNVPQVMPVCTPQNFIM